MRQPPGESDIAVSDALLLSFSTFATGLAGREKTLRPGGAQNNRWREELSHMKRIPPVLPGCPFNLAATVASDLESGGAGTACGSNNPALLPRRETEEFNDLLDLDFILSNSLSHQESVAPTVSSSVSASSSSSPSSSGPPSEPSTCSFSYPSDPGLGRPGRGTRWWWRPTAAGRRACAPRSSRRRSPRALSSAGPWRPTWAQDHRSAMGTGRAHTTSPWGGSSPVGLPRP
jgi:hypothetical protein